MYGSTPPGYSPPLVGKSHEEDTITMHFDWKKQNRHCNATFRTVQKLVFEQFRLLEKAGSGIENRKSGTGIEDRGSVIGDR